MGSKAHAPIYNTDASLAEQNRLNQAAGYQTYANVNSPMGGYSVSVDPNTGKMTVNKNLSENSLLAQQIQANALSRFVADPRTATQAYYNQQMAYVQPQFDAQIDAAKESMANRGIAMGSKTWNDTLAAIENNQDKARTAIANEAMFNAQNYQNNILGQAQTAGGMVVDPALIQGAQGAGLYDTYSKKFENEKQKYQTAMASGNKWGNILGTVGGIAGGVVGGIFGGPGGAVMGAQAGTAGGSGIGGVIDA